MEEFLGGVVEEEDGVELLGFNSSSSSASSLGCGFGLGVGKNLSELVSIVEDDEIALEVVSKEVVVVIVDEEGSSLSVGYLGIHGLLFFGQFFGKKKSYLVL
ncbi:hypothetical protein [Metamycoplasma auris]|uniref:hypothetical protein n=1 Tax=Metamycoplasma auris TaxID=51363 RepID=UPI00126707A0|nr:hypothetical protein [Metamycoplasma auris]